MDWGPETSQADKIIDNLKNIIAPVNYKYLLERGHTKIACLSGHLDKVRSMWQLNAGYKTRPRSEGRNRRKAHHWKVISRKCDVMLYSRAEQNARWKIIYRISSEWHNGNSWPNASRLAAASGIRIPEDISGYRLRQYWTCRILLTPPLTTVCHQPKLP